MVKSLGSRRQEESGRRSTRHIQTLISMTNGIDIGDLDKVTVKHALHYTRTIPYCVCVREREGGNSAIALILKYIKYVFIQKINIIYMKCTLKKR